MKEKFEWKPDSVDWQLLTLAGAMFLIGVNLWIWWLL
jgi:hypothetical protein